VTDKFVLEAMTNLRRILGSHVMPESFRFISATVEAVYEEGRRRGRLESAAKLKQYCQMCDVRLTRKDD